MKKSLIALAFAMTASSSFASNLGSESANVSMDVSLYASVTNFSDIAFTTNGVENDGSINYSGNGSFDVESNGQVNITVNAAAMDHNVHSITGGHPYTDKGYTVSLDGGSAVGTGNNGTASTSVTTAADSTHKGTHSLALNRTTSQISNTLAGDYTGSLSITVSGL